MSGVRRFRMFDVVPLSNVTLLRPQTLDRTVGVAKTSSFLFVSEVGDPSPNNCCRLFRVFVRKTIQSTSLVLKMNTQLTPTYRLETERNSYLDAYIKVIFRS